MGKPWAKFHTPVISSEIVILNLSANIFSIGMPAWKDKDQGQPGQT